MEELTQFETGLIYSRHAVSDDPETFRSDMHIHDRCEIFYFISGNAEYLVEGSVYRLKPGSLLIMRPGEAHCIHVLGTETYERYAINFPLSLLDGIDPERRLTDVFTDRALGSENLYSLPGMESIFEKMCRPELTDYERNLYITAQIAPLLLQIQEMRTNTESFIPSSGFGNDIVDFVNAHLLEPVTTEEIAEHFYLSESQLNRVFKKTTGAPLWKFITAKRLIWAREQIAAGMPAYIVATKCGYNDYSSFYRAYRKRYNSSPCKGKD